MGDFWSAEGCGIPVGITSRMPTYDCMKRVGHARQHAIAHLRVMVHADSVDVVFLVVLTSMYCFKLE